MPTNQPILTIMIAGHRLDRLAHGGIPAIDFSVRRVLQDLINGEDAHDGNKIIVAPSGIRILTGTSPDVDMIGVHAAETFRIPVHVIGFESNVADVGSVARPAERAVLLPNIDGVPPAILESMISARDEIALSYSDILIAVWDSREAREYAGGTIRLIRDAAVNGRPVIVVGVDGAIRRLPSLGLADAVRRRLSYLDPDATELERLLIGYDPHAARADIRLLSQSTLVDDGKKIHHRPQEADFTRGKADFKHYWKPGIFHEVLTALSTLDVAAVKKAWIKDRSRDYYGVSAAELPENMRECHPISEPENLKTEFKVHDLAANRYAGMHRDATWLVYGMSALAVFSAVSGEIGLGGRYAPLFWAIFELFMLAGIVIIYSLAKRGAWHQRWLSHRYSAELIRYARVSMPAMAPSDILKGCFAGTQGERQSVEEDKFKVELMALRRLLIDEGLPSARQEGVPYAVRLHLNECIEYAKHVISDQIAYHGKKWKEGHHASHALHRITYVCFFITALAIISHFFLHTSILLLLTAALPAFAAAIHGISTQNEFERLAAISSATSGELSSLLAALNDCCKSDGEIARKWLLVHKITRDAARSMSGSARQWQEIVIQKSTSLPS